jgi:hypothetical protein
MIETSSISHDRQELSVNTFDKDVEGQRVPSDSESESSERDGESMTMREGGDIEAYRVASNGLYDGKEAPVTRTSTKSSWKDPGPPPDGGLGAWTQGV